MGTRRDVRNAISTMLTNAGVQSVYMGFPTEPISTFPAAIITLPQGKETRAASGKKRIDFEPTVQIWDLSQSGDGVSDELTFDDLLDDIDTTLRGDPTLGGTVLTAGNLYIDTIQPDVTSDTDQLIIVAEKRFDLTVMVNG